MKKKFLSLVLTGLTSIALLGGCGAVNTSRTAMTKDVFATRAHAIGLDVINYSEMTKLAGQKSSSALSEANPVMSKKTAKKSADGLTEFYAAGHFDEQLNASDTDTVDKDTAVFMKFDDPNIVKGIKKDMEKSKDVKKEGNYYKYNDDLTELLLDVNKDTVVVIECDDASSLQTFRDGFLKDVSNKEINDSKGQADKLWKGSKTYQAFSTLAALKDQASNTEN
jgi:hypothetical protein